MAQLHPIDLARDAYTAYGESTGGKNVRGENLPLWEDLGDAVQSAWVAAAGAVFHKVVDMARPLQGVDPWR